MSTSYLVLGLPVLLVGVLVCLAPLFTRPTVQFGVRVPAERAGGAVIRRERHAYLWRTAVLAVCCAVLAGVSAAPGWLWAPPLIVLLELAVGVGCFWAARERISQAKRTEGWFDGLHQTVAVDTTWRTDPQRFPVLWTLPALAVVVATAVTGIVRYPSLPARIAVHYGADGAADRWTQTSVWSAFSLVWAQVLTTALLIGLLVAVHRSRPDTDAADVAGSTRRYRAFLSSMGRALLVFVALADVGLLLGALQIWGFYRLSGGGILLVLAPVLVGAIALVVIAARMGQGGSRLAGEGADASSPDRVNRDDDRFWKGGLLYVNRDDPSVMVGKRFGVGWTLNFGNPKAWWLVGAVVVAVVLVSVVH